MMMVWLFYMLVGRPLTRRRSPSDGLLSRGRRVLRSFKAWLDSATLDGWEHTTTLPTSFFSASTRKIHNCKENQAGED